jgi:hypothetical protein
VSSCSPREPLAVNLSWAATGDLVWSQPPHYLFKVSSGEVIGDLQIGFTR